MAKPFKTLDEQILILKARGLQFDNEDLSKDYLLKNNYYNVVNCYSKFLFSNKDKYVENANFNEIRAIHVFDNEIKNILLKNILTVETYFKSIVSYCFCKEHIGELYPYLQPNNFDLKQIKQVTDLIQVLNKLINVEKSKGNNSISHYMNVHGNVPLWVLSNFMTFGQVVRLFDYSDIKIKNDITKEFNTIINNNLSTTSVRLSPKELSHIMDNIKNVRNVLAHDNKLFDYSSRFSYPYIPEIHNSLFINKTAARRNLYNTYIILRLFFDNDQYNNMRNSIYKRMKNLDKKIKSVNSSNIFNSLGFPKKI